MAQFTHILLYKLAEATGKNTFRALTQGYIHRASGHVSTISVNVQHPIIAASCSQLSNLP